MITPSVRGLIIPFSKTFIMIVVGLFLTLSYMVSDIHTRSVAPPKVETPSGPDIATIIQSSVMSLQQQSKLLVMTSQIHSVATSQLDSMGMSARQTDIQVGEIQFFIDLTNITLENIKVDGERLILSLPRTALTVKQLPMSQTERYDNNSWLFTLSDDARKDLTQQNEQKIRESFRRQSEKLEDQALTYGRSSLTTVLETPLRAVGFSKTVVVTFFPPTRDQ